MSRENITFLFPHPTWMFTDWESAFLFGVMEGHPVFPGYLEHSGAGVTWIVTKVTIYCSLGVVFLYITVFLSF